MECRSTPCCCSSVSCAVCGSWALSTGDWGIHSDGQALAQCSSETLTMHREMAVGDVLWTAPAPCLCTSSLLHSRALLRLLLSILALLSTTVLPGGQLTLTEGAQQLTPTLHQCAALGLPGSLPAPLQHGVTYVFITYLFVTTAPKKHLNSPSDWGWLIPITDFKKSLFLHLLPHPHAWIVPQSLCSFDGGLLYSTQALSSFPWSEQVSAPLLFQSLLNWGELNFLCKDLTSPEIPWSAFPLLTLSCLKHYETLETPFFHKEVSEKIQIINSVPGDKGSLSKFESSFLIEVLLLKVSWLAGSWWYNFFGAWLYFQPRGK